MRVSFAKSEIEEKSSRRNAIRSFASDCWVAPWVESRQKARLARSADPRRVVWVAPGAPCHRRFQFRGRRSSASWRRNPRAASRMRRGQVDRAESLVLECMRWPKNALLIDPEGVGVTARGVWAGSIPSTTRVVPGVPAGLSRFVRDWVAAGWVPPGRPVEWLAAIVSAKPSACPRRAWLDNRTPCSRRVGWQWLRVGHIGRSQRESEAFGRSVPSSKPCDFEPPLSSSSCGSGRGGKSGGQSQG